MRMSKEQIYQAIMQQAKLLIKVKNYTKEEAIQLATIQIDNLLKGLTHNQLNIAKKLKIEE